MSRAKILVLLGLPLLVCSLTMEWSGKGSRGAHKKVGKKHAKLRQTISETNASAEALETNSQADAKSEEMEDIKYDGYLFDKLKSAVRAKRDELLLAQYKDPLMEFRPRFARIPTRKEVDPKRHNPKTNVKGIEVFWQKPRGEIKGIYFGATGCFHQGGDFFTKVGPDGYEFKECKQSSLKTCQGLPESVYSFKYARRRGYLVMSATPDAKNSCWEHKNDASRVRDALDFVLAVEGLPADTRMIATGASQGGYFMFDLQKNMGGNNLMCIAPQCAEIKKDKDVDLHYGGEHLPTMFIYMPLRNKDSECPKVVLPGQKVEKCSENIVPKIHAGIAYLKRKGVRVSERMPDQWPVQQLLQARGYDNVTVAKLVGALDKSKGEFGHKPMKKDGRILDHPGGEWWLHAFRPHVPHKEDSLMKDHSALHQLMQVAYAEHEITAEYTDHIIDFCEGNEDPHAPLRWGRKPSALNAKPKSAQLQERYFAPTPEPDTLEKPRLITDKQKDTISFRETFDKE